VKGEYLELPLESSGLKGHESHVTSCQSISFLTAIPLKKYWRSMPLEL
jgi:hypothetical protein